MADLGNKPGRQSPLKGVRVVELGHIVAGPFAGLIFADLGAEVIKIEHPEGGDSTRQPSSRGIFHSLNRNKKSAALDLRSHRDRAVFTELIRHTDVFIENLGPGAVEKLRIGYKHLSRVNPGLIYCSVKGFLPGPYGHRPLVDEMAQMMGGLAYMTGPPGQPMRAGASIVDMGAATFAVIGALAALQRRKDTGRGEYIVAGMFETVSLWVAAFVAEYQLTGLVPQPMSVRGMSQLLRWEVYDRFTAHDGRLLIIACTSDKHWAGFCQALGLADWKSDPQLQTKDQRLEARSWLLPRIQELVGRYTRDEIARLLDQHGVPMAPINTPADLADDPHLLASGQLLTIEADGRTIVLPALPLRSSGYRRLRSGQAPSLGQHTQEIASQYAPRENPQQQHNKAKLQRRRR